MTTVAGTTPGNSAYVAHVTRQHYFHLQQGSITYTARRYHTEYALLIERNGQPVSEFTFLFNTALREAMEAIAPVECWEIRELGKSL